MKSKWNLIALCVKALTGVIGGSLVLQNEHPYVTLAVLSVGAVANEIVEWYKKRENEQQSRNNA